MHYQHPFWLISSSASAPEYSGRTQTPQRGFLGHQPLRTSGSFACFYLFCENMMISYAFLASYASPSKSHILCNDLQVWKAIKIHDESCDAGQGLMRKNYTVLFPRLALALSTPAPQSRYRSWCDGRTRSQAFLTGVKLGNVMHDG